MFPALMDKHLNLRPSPSSPISMGIGMMNFYRNFFEAHFLHPFRLAARGSLDFTLFLEKVLLSLHLRTQLWRSSNSSAPGDAWPTS